MFGPRGSSSTAGKVVSSAFSLASIANPVLGIAGSLLGGLFGRRGQKDANAQNLAIAREQMAFQERMASTQYQRAAKDLEAAGLNRILALGSPAAAPQGARAQMENPDAPLQKGIEGAVHSALAATRLRQDIKQSQANIRLTNEQAAKVGADKRLVEAQIPHELEKTQKTIQERNNLVLQAAGISTRNQIAELDRQIRSLEIPGVRSASQFYSWLMTTSHRNRDYHLQKVYGNSSVGAVQKYLQHIPSAGDAEQHSAGSGPVAEAPGGA